MDYYGPGGTELKGRESICLLPNFDRYENDYNRYALNGATVRPTEMFNCGPGGHQ